MHDSDIAGVIFFASQFRFAHDAWEDFLHSEHMGLAKLFSQSDYLFLIVHAEADYGMPLEVGDQLDIHLEVSHIGESSFSTLYKIFREKELVGQAKIVHVTVDAHERKKIAIPQSLKAVLNRHISK